MNRESKTCLLQSLPESSTMGRLGKRSQNLLPHKVLIRTSFGGEQPAPVDGGVLVIYARRNG